MRKHTLVLTLSLLVGLTSCKIQDGSSDEGLSLSEACTLGLLGTACDPATLSCLTNTQNITQGTIFGTPNVFAANSDHFAGQSFKPTKSGAIKKVSFYLEYNNNLGDDQPATPVKVELRANCSGEPCSAVIATTDGQLAPASPQHLEFTFTDPPSVTASTTYWLVLNMSISASEGAIWVYHDGDTSAAYTDGYVSDAGSSGGPWTDRLQRDYVFKVFECD